MLGNTACSLDMYISHELVIKKYNQKPAILLSLMGDSSYLQPWKKLNTTPFILPFYTSAFSLPPLLCNFKIDQYSTTMSTMSLALSDNLAPQPITDILRMIRTSTVASATELSP